MNTILEAQTTSTADPSLLQPCGSVSSTGKCASKDVARSRLSICTALDSPHSPKASAVGSPSPWSRTDSPGLSLLSSTAPAALAGSAAAEKSVAGAADAAVAARPSQVKRPGSAVASRSSYALVHTQLLAASAPDSLLVRANSRKSSSDRSSFLNSPSDDSSSPAGLLAADSALDKLLSGKVSRVRSSSVSAATASKATAAVTSPTQHNSTAAGSSRQAAEKLVGTSHAAVRLSLAHVGLLAAPGAGLLPGSPLADAAAAGAAATAAALGSSGSSAAQGRSSNAGSRQQQQQQRRTVAAAALSVSLTGGVGGSTSEHAQQPQTVMLENTASSAMRQSWAGAELSRFQQQQPASCSGQAAVAAAPHSASRKGVQQQKQVSAAQLALCDDVSNSQHGSQLGTAAFRATSRAQANRAGRMNATLSDAPGPAHYRPHHVLTDKHVPATRIVPLNSSRRASPNRAATAAAAAAVTTDASTVRWPHSTSASAAQHEQHQQQTPGQQMLPGGTKTGLHNTGVAAAATAVANATRNSVSDATPRLGDDGPLRGVQPHRVHPKSKVLPGSSAFKAVSRQQLQQRQRLASAGAAADAAVDYFKEGYDSLTRPRSCRGPMPIFAKQTARPASPYITDCPAALGPGSYHRSGSLPISNTGADVAAGHINNSSTRGVLEFDKYSSRPGSAPAGAAGDESDELFTGSAAAGTEWPGLWGWSAAAGGSVSQTGHFTSTFAHINRSEQQTDIVDSDRRPVGGVPQQPSSRDALAYMRGQCPTALTAASAEQQTSQCVGEGRSGGSSVLDDHMLRWQLQRRQHQRKQPGRPCSGGQQQRKHIAGVRPATASAVMVRGAAAAGTMLCGPPTTIASIYRSRETSSPTKQQPSSAHAKPCGSSQPRTGTGGMLAHQDLQMSSSMGFAHTAKRGALLTSSRAAVTKVLQAKCIGSVVPAASVVVVQSGTELSYDSNPEVLGHMRRSPGWTLPPNRTAASKKWAQLSAKAGMQ